LVFWLATLMPVYERENYYAKLVEANLWLKKYLPNWQLVIIGLRRKIEDNWFNFYLYQAKEFVWRSFLGAWLERFIKQMQWDLMAQKKKDLAVLEDKRVIISDTMLKFHESDRRLEYQEKFEKKREELLKNL